MSGTSSLLGPEQNNGPEGIALESNGDILVTDGGTQSILRLSPAGKVVQRIGGANGIFTHLGHIAIDSSGNIYVAEDSANVIQKFLPSGQRIGAWKRDKGNDPDQWDHPETIAMRADGTLVVEDWGNRRIQVLSPDGHTLFSFAGTGLGTAGLCVDRAGNIYQADYKLHHVQKFAPSGALLSVFSNDAGERLFNEGPTSIAVDEHGDLYAADGTTVVKYSQNGRMLARWR